MSSCCVCVCLYVFCSARGIYLATISSGTCAAVWNSPYCRIGAVLGVLASHPQISHHLSHPLPVLFVSARLFTPSLRPWHRALWWCCGVWWWWRRRRLHLCCKVNVLTGVLEEGVGVVADAVSVIGAAVAKARVVAAAPLEGQAAGVGAMRSKGEEKDEMVLSGSQQSLQGRVACLAGSRCNSAKSPSPRGGFWSPTVGHGNAGAATMLIGRQVSWISRHGCTAARRKRDGRCVPKSTRQSRLLFPFPLPWSPPPLPPPPSTCGLQEFLSLSPSLHP